MEGVRIGCPYFLFYLSQYLRERISGDITEALTLSLSPFERGEGCRVA
jgi:hypothetical protein